MPVEGTKEIKIGDPDDGGVYVGKSATTGQPLHTALMDEPKCMTYEQALAAAEKLKALHPTAHVPTWDELDKNLFANRFTGLLKDTFNTSGPIPGRVYLSSDPWGSDEMYVEWFDDGILDTTPRNYRLPVRLVW
jgi:hypothetical protein